MNSLRVTLALALVFSACSKRDKLSEAPNGQDGRALKLTIETPTNLALAFSELSPIGVRVRYLDDDSPAAGLQVGFQVSGAAGGAVLAAVNTTTGNDGRLQNLLTAGLDRANFDVLVSVGTVSDVVHVSVNGVYTGILRVRYTYTGPVALTSIPTRLHPGSTCTGIDPAQPTSVIATRIATAPSQTVQFDAVPEQQQYAVSAAALGPAGDVVATGCLVTPAIIGRGTTTVTMPLQLLPARILGNYDFGLKLHLNEALPGSTGQVLADLDAFFDDPAQGIADQLVVAVANQTGADVGTTEDTLTLAWFTYALLNGIAPDADGDGNVDVADAVTYGLLNNLPPWAVTGLNLGGDITELTTNMTVGGKMAISSVDAAGALAGHWDWSEFLFRWRTGQSCDLADACCGRQRFSGSAVGLAPAGADFTGHVTALNTPGELNYDLVVDPHHLDLQYGQIIFFALTQFVLPAATGQTTVDCAVESLFGCEGAGQFLCGSPNGSSNGDACGCTLAGSWIDSALQIPGFGEVVCMAAVGSVSAQIENSILSLTTSGSGDTYFDVSLAATLKDVDRDLRTDEFTGGADGNLVMNGGSSTFTGDLNGDSERVVCDADNTCVSFQSCHLKVDVLDDCQGRQVCAGRIGPGAGGSNCTLGGQCASGTCVPTGSTSTAGKCFGACGDNADCPSSLSCGATSVALTSDLSVPVNACGL